MHGFRRATTVVAAVLLIASGWITRNKGVTAQTATERTTGNTAALLLQQRVNQRKAVLDRLELKRFEALNQLEFTPRPFPPGIPPRFPMFCWRPTATPPSAIDPHRSLFVHDRATLDAASPTFIADFSLNRTLTQIASQVSAIVPGTTAVSIFRQFWDTQNAAPGLTSGPHCSDNGSTINGFPITCPRNEGQEASGTDVDIQNRIADYKVLALVNRLDLAHKGWRNCGEHRIVYGKRGSAPSKNMIIFEAVLPNPRPGCREGCVPVAEFWKSLSTINDAVMRAQKLDTFYYSGLPGFRPVVHVNHYSANGVTSSYGSSGSGQIRTNQFLQTPASFQPWLLKEFKTVIDCGALPCTFAIVPIMVKVNPHGPLWNEDNTDPRAVDFRADTLAQTPMLASTSLMGIGYGVDLTNDAGQSMSLPGTGFVDDYSGQMNSATAATFRAALATGSLTADQMASRGLTQSCAGCHMPRTFRLDQPGSIGTVTTPIGSPSPTVDSWPNVVTAGFVHVDVMPASVRPELAANPAAFGAGLGQEISPALLDFFLPERKNFLIGQLNSSRCICINRFQFLDASKRHRAIEIRSTVERQFEPRFEALERRIVELEAIPAGERDLSTLSEERAELLLERDKALTAELERNGIKLPDAELLDLKPQAMRLKAASAATGDARHQWALRVEEVNQTLRQEPARRTVTGSFRVH